MAPLTEQAATAAAMAQLATVPLAMARLATVRMPVQVTDRAAMDRLPAQRTDMAHKVMALVTDEQAFMAHRAPPSIQHTRQTAMAPVPKASEHRATAPLHQTTT